MALKAGRVGLNKDLVDEFGYLKEDAPSGEYYTKTQADNKFETKTHVNNNFQKKTLEVPIELLSGSALTVESALQGLNEEKFNRAEQMVLGAKNLLRNHFTGGTFNGLTFVVNYDGSISISGTADANTYITVHSKNSNPIELEQGDYILSGCPEGGSENTYQMFYIEYDLNGQEVPPYKNDYGTGVRFQRTSNNQYNITILIKSGQNMSGKTFYPMIRLASDPDDTYAPYAMTNKELTEVAKLVPSKMDYDKKVGGTFDLNDFTTPSMTYFNGGTLSNNPDGKTFFALIVMGTSGGLRQMVFTKDAMYTREQGGSPAAWSSWYKYTGTAL